VEVLEVPPEKKSLHANEKQLPLIFVVTLQLRNPGLLLGQSLHRQDELCSIAEMNTMFFAGESPPESLVAGYRQRS
jgi:hypothetical protein